jgi:hypothetical protein
MATAVTYRTGTSARALRTVVVEDARTVVLVAPERMELLTGKLVHGTSCGHKFWDQELGTSGDDFAVPASQVVQQREMQIAVKVRHK